MLNLRQLEIFREVIRCQTTVGAAEALAISQPAVSNAIRQIESQLGMPLFDRVGNRLVPTDEAREVMRGSEPIFSLYRAFSEKLKDLRDTRTGSLRVLSTPALANALVPRALKSFLVARPDMRVFFDVRRTPGVVEGVESGFVDVGFSLSPQPARRASRRRRSAPGRWSASVRRTIRWPAARKYRPRTSRPIR